MVAGLGPLSETIGIGQAALRDFVAAEPVSHDIDDFLQAEIRQAGKDLSGGRVTRAREMDAVDTAIAMLVPFQTTGDVDPITK